VREYSNYLSIRPDDDDIRLKLGNLWIDVTEQPTVDPEDWGRAIAYLEDIVRQMPEERHCKSGSSIYTVELVKSQQALDHLGRMIEKFPDDSDLQVQQLGFLLRSQKLDGPDGALG